MEKTLVLIKPDGVQRALIGEIIHRYERTGLKLIGLKMIIPTEELIRKHYLVDPEWVRKVGEKSMASYQSKGLKSPFKDPLECGQAVLGRLQKYMSSGPVIAMIWEGNKAVGIVRKITGGTEPLSSDVGTIRGDLTVDSYDLADTGERAIRNLIHASGSPEEAEKEIAIWFKSGEIMKYNIAHDKILYDVNLDGIRE
ncbi:MAG: nucleoside-diphosphate kinase [Patescibacteria group bacterium]|nr:nucleoside-diphosphate kinase [Patescibacteria group bacterium]MDD5490175.1 nucleoside-diphosphate kinase [Patescibacteria group bacterium]